jgi:hypothetical protein
MYIDIDGLLKTLAAMALIYVAVRATWRLLCFIIEFSIETWRACKRDPDLGAGVLCIIGLLAIALTVRAF